jgi:hypothetical protein
MQPWVFAPLISEQPPTVPSSLATVKRLSSVSTLFPTLRDAVDALNMLTGAAGHRDSDADMDDVDEL